MLDTLTQAFRDIAHAIRGLGTNRDLLSKLEQMENRIMSAVTDSIKLFRDAYAAFNARYDAAFAGVVADLKALGDKIAALEAAVGDLEPEAKEILDGIIADREAITTKLEALDAQTPPPPPTT